MDGSVAFHRQKPKYECTKEPKKRPQRGSKARMKNQADATHWILSTVVYAHVQVFLENTHSICLGIKTVLTS